MFGVQQRWLLASGSRSVFSVARRCCPLLHGFFILLGY